MLKRKWLLFSILLVIFFVCSICLTVAIAYFIFKGDEESKTPDVLAPVSTPVSDTTDKPAGEYSEPKLRQFNIVISQTDIAYQQMTITWLMPVDA